MIPASLFLFVDNRNRQKAVSQDLVRDELATILHMDRDHIPQHQVADLCLRLGHDQLSQRDQPQQVSLVIHDVDVVDRFAAWGLNPQPIESLSDGDVGGQRGIVGRDKSPALFSGYSSSLRISTRSA